MAYAVWSVIAGEQPTAAKWNILGTNGASFNDGTGIGDNAILTRHVTDANITSPKLTEAFFRGRQQALLANTTPTGLTVQFGWSFVTGTGVSLRASKTITFPTAFSVTPIVFMSTIGIRSGSDPAAIGDFTKITDVLGDNGWAFEPSAISISTFVATINRDVGNIPNTSRLGFSWIAIGTV